MQAGTKASQYSIGSGRSGTSSGRMMLVYLASGRDDTSSGRIEQWIDGRPDGMARSSGRLTGNLNSSDLQAESSDITLNSRILVYNIFYIQVFLSIHRMRPIKLTVFFFKVKLHTLLKYPVTQNNPKSLWFDNPYYSIIDSYYCEVVKHINLKST